MLHKSWLAPPSYLALTVGAVVLVVCGLTRASAQPLVSALPVVAAISTLLVFILPGAAAGAIAPAGIIWNGAILGVIAAVFSTLQAMQFQAPDLGSPFFYQAIGFLACLSVPLCLVGTIGGHFVRPRH